MGISADDLAGIRSTIVDFLPETATIARTGQTLSCRVRDDGTEIPLPGGAGRALTRVRVLRRWELLFADAEDVVSGDVAAVAGKGSYVVLTTTSPSSTSVSTLTYALQLGAVVLGSTMRAPASLVSPTAAGGYTVHLPSVTCYQFLDRLLMPVSPQFVQDTFGVQIQQPALVIAAAPPATEPFPIKATDRLVLPAGAYTVHGVQPWAPGFVCIYVETPIT